MDIRHNMYTIGTTEQIYVKCFYLSVMLIIYIKYTIQIYKHKHISNVINALSTPFVACH